MNNHRNNRLQKGCALLLASLMKLAVYAEEYTFTTIAGNAGYGSSDGAGAAARFSLPAGIAIDANGDLVVAEGNNNSVRKLTASGTNWTVSTLAGRAPLNGSANGTNGAARFDFPFGVAVGAGGDIFVTDGNNATIRKLTLTNGAWIVSTIAGLSGFGGSGTADGTNSVARFNQPLGAAMSGGNILIADTGNHTLRKITPSGTNWVVTTLAGMAEIPGGSDGTNFNAAFKGPMGVAVDGSGNAFIADSGNHTIRKVTFIGTNSVVSTIAGLADTSGNADGTNANARFNYPTGLALDAAGNIYVCEYGNSLVRKVAPVGTNWVVSTLAGSFGGSADGTNSGAKFFQPYGITMTTNGIPYVTDSSNNTIRKLTPQGTNWIVTTIAGSAAGSETSVEGTNFNARFADPYPGAIDNAGNIYIADSGNYTIRKLTHIGADWVAQTIAGLPHFSGSADGTNASATFLFPYALAADASGNLFVADTFNSVIRKLTAYGTNWGVTTIAGTAGFGGSGSADGTNNGAQFNGPFGITTDGSGNVFVADTSNNKIRKLTLEGTNWIVTSIAGLAGFGNSGSADGTNTVARFKSPQGIVSGSGGVLYVTDTSNNTIRKMTPQGTNWITTTIAGLAGSFMSVDGTNTAARFAGPAGIAIDGSGNLYISDRGNALVRKMTLIGTNWVVTTIGGLSGVYGNADGTSTNALFNGPNSLVVDSAGRLFIGDNNAIRMGELVSTVVEGPALKIFLSANQAVVSWPSWASNYSLEMTNTLPGGLPWVTVGGATLSGTNYFKTNTINGKAFFRLHQP